MVNLTDVPWLFAAGILVVGRVGKVSLRGRKRHQYKKVENILLLAGVQVVIRGFSPVLGLAIAS